MTPSVTVRRLVADDWRDYRDIRLAALAADPGMFGSSLEREQAFDEDDWRQRAPAMALAYLDGAPVGVAGWFWTDEPRTADLVAMWVAPAARGRGVGAALVRDIVDQTVNARGATLELGVVVENEAATGLYRREGFVESGREVGVRSGDLLRRMRYARERGTA